MVLMRLVFRINVNEWTTQLGRVCERGLISSGISRSKFGTGITNSYYSSTAPAVARLYK
jgi:hypothetical protein